MRGEIPRRRIDEIRVGLPEAFQLVKLFPTWQHDTALVSDGDTTIDRALWELWDGRELLSEAEHALIEADACKVWSECQNPPDPVHAAYFARFYLDDVALRLYASCERLAKAINCYYNLGAETKGGSLFLPVLKKFKETHPHHSLNGSLWALRNNGEWRFTAQYRNDWVHNDRPNVAALGPPFRMTAKRTDAPGCKILTVGQQSCKQVTIQKLRANLRGAYGVLFKIFESWLTTLQSDLANRTFGWIQSSKKNKRR